MKCPKCGHEFRACKDCPVLKEEIDYQKNAAEYAKLFYRNLKLESVLEAAIKFHAKHAEINDDEGDELLKAIKEAEGK